MAHFSTRASAETGGPHSEENSLFARAEWWIDPFGLGLQKLVMKTRALRSGAMPDAWRGRGAGMTRRLGRILDRGNSDWHRTNFRRGTVGGGTGAKRCQNADHRPNRPFATQRHDPPR